MNNDYTCVEELLSDESFLSYCDHTDNVEEERWRDWIGVDPCRKALVAQAAELLNEIREAERQLEEQEIKEEQVSASIRVLMKRIDELDRSQ